MISKDDVILAALHAAHAAYEFDSTEHESDEAANEMYDYMMKQIAKLPLLAVAEYKASNPATSYSDAEIFDLLFNRMGNLEKRAH